MLKRYLIVFFLGLFCFSFNVKAQKGVIKLDKKKLSPEDELALETAHTFFEEGNYILALPYFQSLNEAHPEDIFFKYKLGVCYLYKTDQHDLALKFLKEVYDEKSDAADIYFYLGKAYLINYKFDEAIEQLNKYVKEKIPDFRKKEALRVLENCQNGKLLVANPVNAKIENIGPPINTEAAEYVPVISADESVMIYTYRGENSVGGLQEGEGYYEDVYISEKVDGKWSEPRNIGDNINGYSHDASIALSSDGQKLFIYKNTPANKGDIYISYLQGKEWSMPEKVKGDVNTNSAWEGSVSLASDERTLYFSSERDGGLGGKDLYKAEIQSDGSWGNVQNLGPAINTIYDDDAPFFHPDGKTMYFSSQGHSSMGGYDIFTTELKEDKTWTTPENMGYPINTTGDDIYFVLAANGTTGYYSSGKAGGQGQQDIYVLYIEPKKVPLVLVKGVVTLDDKPVEASVSVLEENNDQSYLDLKSNEATGKYLANFPAGKNYKLVFNLTGYDGQTEKLEAVNVTDYLEKEINIKFYSKKDSLAMAEKPKEESPKEEVAKVDTVIPTPTPTPAPVDTVQNLKGLIETIADKSAEGLIFRVQIAAYKKPQNYNFQRLLSLGKVERVNLNDGITRFVIGEMYNTLNEAREFNKKVIAAGQTDAFVTAIYQGKRVYIEDLIKQNVIFK